MKSKLSFIALAWISVEDRLPAKDLPVLAAGEGLIYIASYPGNDLDEYEEHWNVLDPTVKDYIGITGVITHWMPLPEPPKEL
jgi:hypothetical protein